MLGQSSHGGLGLRRPREGFLAPLDAVDDPGRRFARLLGRRLAVTADGDAPRRAVRPPRLDDVFLATRGVDPDPESGQVAVLEDGVA